MAGTACSSVAGVVTNAKVNSLRCQWIDIQLSHNTTVAAARGAAATVAPGFSPRIMRAGDGWGESLGLRRL